MAEDTLHHLCDGKVVVYRRVGAATPNWYVRVKIDKTGKWKKFTSKTDDLDKAKEFAIRKAMLFEEMINNNLAVDTKRFSYVADYVIKELQADIDSGTGKATYVDYIRAINRFKTFFGNKYIGNITYQDLVDFDRERTRKLGRKAKQSTVNVANTALLRVFNSAVRKGWVHQSQVVSYKNDGLRGERRPYFELHEYQKLYRYMRKYVRLGTKDSSKGGVKNRTIMIRELLRDYVLFLTNSGLRHGTETRNLRWKHISETVINGQQYLLIKLDMGKTGRRTIVCRHSVRKYLDRIKERFENLKGKSFNELINVEDYVFRLRDGSIPKDLHGAFKIMLRNAKLLDDVNGNRRSLYSLRHTYATFQILYSKIDLHTLAKNMGTSIAMLERHYSHLEVIHKAELLAGRAEGRGKAEKKATKNTEILLVDGDISDFRHNSQVLLKQKDEDNGLLARKVKDTGHVG